MEKYINKIINKCCIKGLDELKENNINIDLTITSPPYYNARDYSTWETYQDYLNFLEKVFSKILKITKEGRMCVVNIGVIIVAREKRSSESKRIPIPFNFVNLMEKIGWKFLEDIIWVKPSGAAKNRNGGFFQHRQPVAYKPNVINEYIFVFQKPSKNLIDKITRSYKGEIKEKSLVKEEYEKTNVWKINPKTRSKHPAPYPEELVEKVLKYYSYIDDLILDPFMGSGTTAIVCEKFNRKYVGFEIHKKYIEIFLTRNDKNNKDKNNKDTKNINIIFNKSLYDKNNKEETIEYLLKRGILTKKNIQKIIKKYKIGNIYGNKKDLVIKLYNHFWEDIR